MSEEFDFDRIVKKALDLSLGEALSDGGLWFDGTYLYFRQVRLGKIGVDLREGRSRVAEEQGVLRG